jgi:hypothetical protein
MTGLGYVTDDVLERARAGPRLRVAKFGAIFRADPDGVLASRDNSGDYRFDKFDGSSVRSSTGVNGTIAGV